MYPDNAIEVISSRSVSLLELFFGSVDLLGLRAQYTSTSALLESVYGNKWPYINLMINLYDNYLAELRLELVFLDLQSDALPTALSRSEGDYE